jgi:hypothetical protein
LIRRIRTAESDRPRSARRDQNGKDKNRPREQGVHGQQLPILMPAHQIGQADHRGLNEINNHDGFVMEKTDR